MQLGCNNTAIIVVLILGMVTSGAYSGGSLMNNLDLGRIFLAQHQEFHTQLPT
jgi:hypothetical protein